MEIHNILELLANPHPEFHPHFWDHVDHFYILSELCILFHDMYRIYGSALGGSDMSEINVTRQKHNLLYFCF